MHSFYAQKRLLRCYNNDLCLEKEQFICYGEETCPDCKTFYLSRNDFYEYSWEQNIISEEAIAPYPVLLVCFATFY
jgi:hypothetical protein